MEEQEYADMQVPPHLDPENAEQAQHTAGAAAPAAATAVAEGDAQAQSAILEARIAEFKTAAGERGIVVADVDFSTLTSEQLDALVAQRLA